MAFLNITLELFCWPLFILRYKYTAPFFGKSEVEIHRFPRFFRVSIPDGLIDALVMLIESPVVFFSQVHRPPDTLLEFFHGVENALHQVQPDYIVSRLCNDDMEISVKVLGRGHYFKVPFHLFYNLLQF